MVLIHIVCHSPEQATEIVDFLLDEKLVLNAYVSSKLLYEQLKNGIRDSFEQTLVMGTTKALLFTQINQSIREQFSTNPPLIYAMPIIYMDELQSSTLRESTKKV